MLDQGELLGEPSCGPPSWLHSLSRAALLLCMILPFVAILLLVSFNSSKDTFPVGITSLAIQATPGLLKSRTIPIFLRNGVPKNRIIVFYVRNVEVFFDYIATNLYGHMGSVVDHRSTTDTCQLQCNRLFQGKCINAYGSREFQG